MSRRSCPSWLIGRWRTKLQLYSKLRRLILSGQYHSGSAVPIPRSLSRLVVVGYLAGFLGCPDVEANTGQLESA